MENVSWGEARVCIVPFGFEATTTYGQGTAEGPMALIKASHQVEIFDEELWQSTSRKVKIVTLDLKNPDENFIKAEKRLREILAEILKNKKIPVVFGGEHSLTPMVVKTYQEHGFKSFSVLQFDAHADLRNGYLGQKNSHASAMRRVLDFPGTDLVQVGIRNISDENDELNFWKKNQKKIKTFWAKDKKSWEVSEMIKSLKKDVYLTFDVDVFDSSLMPSTGTPEPGGLNWFEVVSILREACQNKNIIGADFVELAPIAGFHAPDFLAAKLVYKTIGYIFNKK